MKSKIIAIFLCLACICMVAGCGNQAPSSAAAPASAAPEAFGDMNIAATPSEEAQITALPEAGTTPEPASNPEDAASQLSASDEALPEKPADMTELAVTTVILCDSSDQLSYSPSDPMYFWRAMGYLVGAVGTDCSAVSVTGDTATISAKDIPLFAYALFADFDGEIPSVTEEDPLVSMGEGNTYLINMLDQGELTLNMTETRYDAGADVFTEQAELFRDGESLGAYTVTLQNYAGDSSGAECFAYSIVDVAPAA